MFPRCFFGILSHFYLRLFQNYLKCIVLFPSAYKLATLPDRPLTMPTFSGKHVCSTLRLLSETAVALQTELDPFSQRPNTSDSDEESAFTAPVLDLFYNEGDVNSILSMKTCLHPNSNKFCLTCQTSSRELTTSVVVKSRKTREKHIFM